MPEGPQELNALSVCAVQYFANTSYASCATNLMALSTSALNVQPSGCYMGYCDFVRCLRRTNSVNLITQCTREARTGVNITLDSDNGPSCQCKIATPAASVAILHWQLGAPQHKWTSIQRDNRKFPHNTLRLRCLF
ncbi:jg9052 [Pararge aegeria aegeria]|uniref:Jg9052 protein n=1 Tax=Pararge aegeria aegeria TaxID=348720 RepID=A0A8S4REK7_9NEOP|nr:jg9052 [Pararge aegeria aegeria]